MSPPPYPLGREVPDFAHLEWSRAGETGGSQETTGCWAHQSWKEGSAWALQRTKIGRGATPAGHGPRGPEGGTAQGPETRGGRGRGRGVQAGTAPGTSGAGSAMSRDSAETKGGSAASCGSGWHRGRTALTRACPWPCLLQESGLWPGGR